MNVIYGSYWYSTLIKLLAFPMAKVFTSIQLYAEEQTFHSSSHRECSQKTALKESNCAEFPFYQTLQAVTEVCNIIVIKRLQHKRFLSLIGFWIFLSEQHFLQNTCERLLLVSLKKFVNSSSKGAANYWLTFQSQSICNGNFGLTFLFLQNTRSSFMQMFFKIGVPKIFALFTGKHLCCPETLQIY